MSFKKSIQKITIIASFVCAILPAHAQDLLARQAPIDRKMKAVDTLTLRSIIEKEQEESPASELYQEWDNRYAHKRTEMPDTFKIDLRHFCMPTPSRVVTSNFGNRWGRPHKGLDILATLSVLHSVAKCASYAMRQVAMANISSSDIPMVWKPFTDIFQSNW